MPPSSTCFDLLWKPRRLSAYDRFVQGELSTSSSGFDGIYEDAIPRMLCSVFPHIALFHVIKSMLSDETSLEWRFYFKLCIQSFEDLYSLFPVFRTMSEGFVCSRVLSGISVMALNVMTSSVFELWSIASGKCIRFMPCSFRL